MIRPTDSTTPSISTGATQALEDVQPADEQGSVENAKLSDTEQPQQTQNLGSQFAANAHKSEQAFTAQAKARELNSQLVGSGSQEKYVVGPGYSDVRNGKAELHRGHAGAGVFTLQTKLTKAGIPTKPDSYFGPKTEASLKQFQSEHGLTPTGKLDKSTLQELDKFGGADPVLPQPKPKPHKEPDGPDGPGPINPQKLPDDPRLVLAKTYDMASNGLQNYHKGDKPAFDAVVQKLINESPELVVTSGEDDAQGQLVLSQKRFFEAARQAGFNTN